MAVKEDRVSDFVDVEVGELGPQNEKVEEVMYVLQDKKYSNWKKLNTNQESFQTGVVFKTKEDLVSSLLNKSINK